MSNNKPVLVKLAEWLTGYNSGISEVDLESLREACKRLQEDKNSYETENKALKDAVAKLEGQVTELKEEIDNLRSLNNTIVQLKESEESKSDDTISSPKSLPIQEESDIDFVDKPREEETSEIVKMFVNKIITTLDNSEVLLPEIISKNQVFKYFSEQMEDCLSLADITTFEDINCLPDPLFHQVVATRPSDDPTKVGYISASLGKGYRLGDKCVKEQPVEIYV